MGRQPVLLLIILLVTRLVSAEIAHEPVRLVTGEWPPFASSQLADSGSTVQLVRAVLEKAGLEARIDFTGWDVAQLELRRGDALAAFPFVASEAFQQEFLLSDTLFSGKNCFVYHASRRPDLDGFVFQSLEQLGRYRLGVLAGSFIEKDFRQAGLGLVSASSIESALADLIAGQSDMYIDNTAVILDAIARRFPAEIEHIRLIPGIYGELRPNVLLVSRKHEQATEFLTRFNQALRELKAAGVWAEALSRYRLNIQE